MDKLWHRIIKEDCINARVAILVCAAFPVVAHSCPHFVKMFLLGCVIAMPILALVSIFLAAIRGKNEEVVLALIFAASFIFNLTFGLEMML